MGLPAGVAAILSQSSFEGLVGKPDHSRARKDWIVKTETVTVAEKG